MSSSLLVENPLAARQLEFWRATGYEGGYVYFVQGTRWHAVKIDYATDPIQRLAELQTGSADVLRLLFVAPATRRDETRLHQRFAEGRRNGEWFSGPALQLILIYAEAVTTYLVEAHDGTAVPQPFPTSGVLHSGAEVREVRSVLEYCLSRAHGWHDTVAYVQTQFPGWTDAELRDQRAAMLRSTRYDIPQKLRRGGYKQRKNAISNSSRPSEMQWVCLEAGFTAGREVSPEQADAILNDLADLEGCA